MNLRRSKIRGLPNRGIQAKSRVLSVSQVGRDGDTRMAARWQPQGQCRRGSWDGKEPVGRFERPYAAVPLSLHQHGTQASFPRELPLIFLFLTLQLPPLRAAKAGRDREEGAFDPAAHEWQKSGEGRRRGSRSEEWRAINLSHEHVPLTSGLATPG